MKKQKAEPKKIVKQIQKNQKQIGLKTQSGVYAGYFRRH
jgi:hypothetical protein